MVIEVLEQISGSVANIPLSNPGCLDNIYSRYRRNSGTIKSIAIWLDLFSFAIAIIYIHDYMVDFSARKIS